MKSKPSKLSFSNLSTLSPLDLTTSNEATTVAITATAKDEERVTEAILAIMVETMATRTIVEKAAKTTKIGADIPTTRISLANYTDGDTVPTNALYSESELENPELSSSSSPHPSTSQKPAKPFYCSPNHLWHLRFAHASTTTLRKIPYIRSSHDSTRCVVCIRAKQSRKPFHAAVSDVSRKLERIHSDICGPFPASKGLTKLLLTFLDEYTHWCWVATIDDKSSATVLREFQRLIKQIKTETKLKIKYLRTDGGGEYLRELKPILAEMGIQHEPTASYSPQSNGKAERLNRTLKTFARAMLY